MRDPVQEEVKGKDNDDINEVQSREKKLHDELQKEFAEEIPTTFRLRRVFQTQTLLHVAPLQREETHRVIRKYRNYKDYFFRITLTGENFDKLFFGGENRKIVLNFMISVLGRGISVGPN